MSLAVAFTALGAGVVVWIILVSRLTARPWEMQGSPAVGEFTTPTRRGATRVGLWVFLAVVTSLFGLFLSAYFMRMGHGHGEVATRSDWQALREPGLLWLNTLLLILGSIAMQWTRAAAARGDLRRTRLGLLAAGALTVAFIAGQLMAWRVLGEVGYFTARNPAAAFFVLLTAVHALHLAGGLFVWARTLVRLVGGRVELIDARVSVDLCAVYWHYLLLVWLVLFGVLLAT